MKKNFGQNFLKNKKIIDIIINSAQINKRSIIYEVGPGDGALTTEIIKKKPQKFISIEIDKSLEPKLIKIFKNTNYKLIFCDALKFNETIFFKRDTIIISNLPYNISVKLLIKWINDYLNKKWFKEMILMFQKEVADRIIATENTKKYGRLTLFVSAFFKVSKIVEINKEDFFPSPKVDSVLLKFTPLEIPQIPYENFNKLEILTRLLFSNRRKKIRKKLEKVFSKEDFKKINIPNISNLRAENLTKEDYFFLTNILKL